MSDTDKKPKEPSAAMILGNIAVENFDLGITPSGDPYALKIGSHIARPIRGEKCSLRYELASLYYDHAGCPAPSTALAETVVTMAGLAMRQSPAPLHLRIATHGSDTWIDLGDPAEHAIRISPNSWDVAAEDVPVLFRRTNAVEPLPIPETAGDLEELWDHVDMAEDQRPLLLAFIIGAYIAPDVPHPIVALFAEQGSGKSSTTKKIVSLIDPSGAPVRKPPKDVEAWVTMAQGSYVIGLDNLSNIPAWLSDTLCRASTGDGDARRALYTDDDLRVFAFKRCVIINGIDPGALEGDLSQRLVTLDLEKPAYRPESQMWAAWFDARPRILGALLDLAVKVKAVLPEIKPDPSARMADYACILAAVDHVLGTNGAKVYAAQAGALAVASLDSDPFIGAMRAWLGSAEFEGTAKELLHRVRAHAEGQQDSPHWRAPRGWPDEPRRVTQLLRRHAPGLRASGWVVEDLGNANRSKTLRWRLAGVTPAPSGHDAGNAGVAGMKSKGVHEDCDQARVSTPARPRNAFPGQEGGAGVAGMPPSVSVRGKIYKGKDGLRKDPATPQHPQGVSVPATHASEVVEAQAALDALSDALTVFIDRGDLEPQPLVSYVLAARENPLCPDWFNARDLGALVGLQTLESVSPADLLVRISELDAA